MSTPPLPDWLDPLYGAEQMRAMDRWAIEERGVPSLDLMERAGSGLALLTDRAVARGPVAVVCGKGNNGGDGLVAGRLLRELGRRVRVLLLAEPSEYKGDALVNLERLAGAHEPFDLLALADAAVVVDAIFGTGFDDEPHGVAKDAIEAIAAFDGPVVAADVASGVDASTGEAARVSVVASTTVTFAAAKPAHWIAPGKQQTGELHVIDIKIPPGAPVTPDVGLLTERVHALVPSRNTAATKFSSGHVVVAGGSRGLTGAPCLAAEAAMRAGAGYVTALVPASLELVFETRLLEVMTRGLPDDDGALSPAGVDAALAAVARAGALVLGPGAGRNDAAFAFVRALAAQSDVPLLLDADGLNAHAGGAIDALATRSAPTVLTPHAGELARLLGSSSDEVSRRRLRSAREAARRANAVVVLKGDDTIIALPDGRAAVNSLSAPALATAGTGDVLSGVIGAFLAKGMDPFAAACAGVRRHAAAGRVAADEYGTDGVVASDVIAALPHALRGEPAE
jgi:NAD(P)H-hydrate epimerase